MKKIILLALCFSLSACFPVRPSEDKSVVTKYKYIVIDVPEQMTSIPDSVTPIDVQTATDKDAALWIINSEKRSQTMEKQLKAIRQYQTDRIKSLNEEDLKK